jgi:hypothetical protein
VENVPIVIVPEQVREIIGFFGKQAQDRLPQIVHQSHMIVVILRLFTPFVKILGNRIIVGHAHCFAGLAIGRHEPGSESIESGHF